MKESPVNMNHLSGLWKSIIVGGAAAGLVSIIPIINFLNLFFMMWMAVGGGITVYLLCRENDDVKVTDALLTGSLGGVLGGVIFGVFIFVAISNISIEKIEKVISMAQAFFPGIREEVESILQADRLKALSLMMIALVMFFSLVSGAVGGIISRSMFNKKENDE